MVFEAFDLNDVFFLSICIFSLFLAVSFNKTQNIEKPNHLSLLLTTCGSNPSPVARLNKSAYSGSLAVMLNVQWSRICLQRFKSQSAIRTSSLPLLALGQREPSGAAT